MKKNKLILFFLIILVSKLYANNINNQIIKTEEKLIKNQPEDRFKNYVKIQVLNKVTGMISLIDIKVGENKDFETIEIKPIKCWKSYPNEKTENKLLLKVYEKKQEIDIFYGWFFSSSPSISDLEDKTYDIKLINCYNKED